MNTIEEKQHNGCTLEMGHVKLQGNKYGTRQFNKDRREKAKEIGLKSNRVVTSHDEAKRLGEALEAIGHKVEVILGWGFMAGAFGR